MSGIDLEYWYDDDPEFEDFLPDGSLTPFRLDNIAADHVLQLMPTAKSFERLGHTSHRAHVLSMKTREDVAAEMSRMDEGMVLALNMLPKLMKHPERFGTFCDSNPPPHTSGFTTDIGRMRISLNKLKLYQYGVLHDHPTREQENTPVGALQLASTRGYRMGMVDPKELLFDGYGFRHRSFDKDTGAVDDSNWSYSSFGQARPPTPFDLQVNTGDYYAQPSRIRHAVAEPPVSRGERFAQFVEGLGSDDWLETLKHPHEATRSTVHSVMLMRLEPGERSDTHVEKMHKFIASDRAALWSTLTKLATDRLKILAADDEEPQPQSLRKQRDPAPQETALSHLQS